MFYLLIKFEYVLLFRNRNAVAISSDCSFSTKVNVVHY